MAANYYSLDVLYCLPVIQTARFGALETLSRSNSKTLTLVAIFCALAWSLAEASISWPNFPISAFLMNVVTRGVTFTVIGRVVTKLWQSKEYSHKDDLTGLANRLELIKKFESKQLQSEQSGTPYSLLFINIDRFRTLNDKLGHQVGDDALKALADTLRDNSRSLDIPSRMGSDEFVLLLPETDQKSCERLGTRIALAAEKKFNQNSWEISLSFGCVTETGKKRSIDDLLREASGKMRLSKNAK
jgi:diguanylate cyclase (GGDEF)-like protein